MKDFLFNDNRYYSKIKKPSPAWAPEQRQAYEAGYQFGLHGVKQEFNSRFIKYWNWGFEAAMQVRWKAEAALCQW